MLFWILRALARIPFSDAVLVGNTLYLGGTAWWDKTDKPPADTEEQAKLALDAFKHLLESQGMEMNDLVSVQVYCTDLSFSDKFNGVYELTFTNNPLLAHSLAPLA